MEETRFIFSIIIIIIIILIIIIVFISLLNSIIYKVPLVWTFLSDFNVMKKWLKKYNLKWKYLVDLWSWTWKVLRFFEREFNMKTTGYEIDLWNILIAKFFNKIFWLKAKIVKKSYFDTNLSKYDYIYIYLYPELIEKIQEKIWYDCKEWTIIFSNAFKLKKYKPIEILKDEKWNDEIYIYKIGSSN